MRGDKVQRWMASLATERERRQMAKLTAAGGDPGEWLIAKLDEMGERITAAPDYVPPTPAEAHSMFPLTAPASSKISRYRIAARLHSRPPNLAAPALPSAPQALHPAGTAPVEPPRRAGNQKE
jgi:hypothetical protein